MGGIRQRWSDMHFPLVKVNQGTCQQSNYKFNSVQKYVSLQNSFWKFDMSSWKKRDPAPLSFNQFLKLFVFVLQQEQHVIEKKEEHSKTMNAFDLISMSFLKS